MFYAKGSKLENYKRDLGKWMQSFNLLGIDLQAFFVKHLLLLYCETVLQCY